MFILNQCKSYVVSTSVRKITGRRTIGTACVPNHHVYSIVTCFFIYFRSGENQKREDNVYS